MAANARRSVELGQMPYNSMTQAQHTEYEILARGCYNPEFCRVFLKIYEVIEAKTEGSLAGGEQVRSSEAASQSTPAAVDTAKGGGGRRMTKDESRSGAWYFWKFVHNTLIHPWFGLPWEPRWLQRAHDWTAERCKGGG